jgi:hypothetical protein
VRFVGLGSVQIFLNYYEMKFECEHVLCETAPLSAEKINVYLNRTLNFLNKIDFSLNDVERLLKTNVANIYQLELSVDERYRHDDHIKECFFETFAIEELMGKLYGGNLTWLRTNNKKLYCAPIDILPCCSLAALSAVRIILQEEYSIGSSSNQDLDGCDVTQA